MLRAALCARQAIGSRAMVKFIKTGRITILTGGRYAGKKALVAAVGILQKSD